MPSSAPRRAPATEHGIIQDEFRWGVRTSVALRLRYRYNFSRHSIRRSFFGSKSPNGNPGRNFEMPYLAGRQYERRSSHRYALRIVVQPSVPESSPPRHITYILDARNKELLTASSYVYSALYLFVGVLMPPRCSKRPRREMCHLQAPSSCGRGLRPRYLVACGSPQPE